MSMLYPYDKEKARAKAERKLIRRFHFNVGWVGYHQARNHYLYKMAELRKQYGDSEPEPQPETTVTTIRVKVTL